MDAVWDVQVKIQEVFYNDFLEWIEPDCIVIIISDLDLNVTHYIDNITLVQAYTVIFV